MRKYTQRQAEREAARLAQNAPAPVAKPKKDPRKMAATAFALSLGAAPLVPAGMLMTQTPSDTRSVMGATAVARLTQEADDLIRASYTVTYTSPNGFKSPTQMREKATLDARLDAFIIELALNNDISEQDAVTLAKKIHAGINRAVIEQTTLRHFYFIQSQGYHLREARMAGAGDPAFVHAAREQKAQEVIHGINENFLRNWLASLGMTAGSAVSLAVATPRLRRFFHTKIDGGQKQLNAIEAAKNTQALKQIITPRANPRRPN